MYIILVGAGGIGLALAELLNAEDHDVVVIDKDPIRAKKMSLEKEVVTINGDATDIAVLQKAGISQADLFISLTDSDEINLVVGLIAKEYGVKTVAISLIKTNYKKEVLEKLGIDMVIHPNIAAAGYIAQMISSKDILDLSFFSVGDAELIEQVITKKTKYHGLHIVKFKELLPPNSTVIGYFKNAKFYVYNQDDRIEEGQKMLLVAKKDEINNLKKLF
jgi:trk system potassium uptake protein